MDDKELLAELRETAKYVLMFRRDLENRGDIIYKKNNDGNLYPSENLAMDAYLRERKYLKKLINEFYW